jgi:hypothetical protein
MDSFNMAGEYSKHVAVSNLLGLKPMSYARWVRVNTPKAAA